MRKMKKIVKSGYKKKTIVFARSKKKKKTASKHANDPDFVPRHTLKRRISRSIRKEGK
jgi:hypothetical protein